MAKVIDAQPGTIISASQDENVLGTAHQVFLVAETIKYRGANDQGLRIFSDGDGSASFFAIVSLNPYEAYLPANNNSNVNNLPWTLTPTAAELAKDSVLNIDGTEGDASLRLQADGSMAAVNVSGYPLNFSGGNVLIRARGKTQHRINVGFFGTVSGDRPGITLANTSNVVFDAVAAPGGAGGTIQVKSDIFTTVAPLFSLKADGPTTGDGDGGTILSTSSKFLVDQNSRVRMTADAASTGTGNAVVSDIDADGPQAIKFSPGNTSPLSLGHSKGRIDFSARGGQAGGNGGGVKISAGSDPSLVAQIQNAPEVVDVSAPGANGNGGKFYLNYPRVLFVFPQSGTTPANSIVATGGSSSGEGGTVKFNRAQYSGGANRTTLNMNAHVKVDSAFVSGNSSVFAGRIINSGIDCRQYQTGSSWPSSWWDCANSDSPTSEEAGIVSAAQSLPSQLQSYLRATITGANPNVQIYAMKQHSDYLAYFGLPGAGGIGLWGISDVTTRVAVSFTFTKNGNGSQTQSSASFSGSPTIVQSSMVHELGHNLDYIWGLVSTFSANPGDFANLRAGDFASMDAQDCPVVWNASICNNQQLSNSNVLLLLDEQIDPARNATKYNQELFARIFAHRLSILNSNIYSTVPNLEKAYEFMPGANAFVDSIIANPPAAVN